MRPGQSDTGTTAPARRAGVREWVGLAVLALPILLLAIDLTALHLAVPHIAADLGAGSTQQLWIIDVYGFLLAGLLITMGTLGDRIGRRRLLLIGAVAFGAASIAAAYSTTPEMLIVTRALLGAAGATLMPSTLSLISNMFHDPKQRGFAIAVWGSCFAGGGAVGPVIGGVLLQWFWWGSVFLMAVPIMVLLLIAAPFLLPEFRDPQPGRLDLPSVALSLLAILPFVFAFKDAAKHGWGAAPVAALLVAAVAGWAFARRQRGLASPLMDLGLFRYRVFTVGLGSLLLGTVVQGSFILLYAQYLQLVQGLSALESGLWMAPFAAANIIGAMTAPMLAARIGAGRTIALGLLVMAVGFTVFAQAPAEAGLIPAVAAAAVISIGVGPLMVLVIDLVIGAAPKERSGSASSMSQTCSDMGMALGVATLGAVGTAVYRAAVSVPDGVPAESAATAADSMAGAASAARDLPAEASSALLEAARQAYMTGLDAVSYTSIAILLVLAAATWFFLKPAPEARPEGDGAPAPAPDEEGDGGERQAVSG